MKGLTNRQQEVLEFIKLYIVSHKYPPTIREVAEHFKISVKGSYDHIKALEKKKYIKCKLFWMMRTVMAELYKFLYWEM